MTDAGNLVRREWASATQVLASRHLDHSYLLNQESLDGQPIVVGFDFSAPGSYYDVQGFDGFGWAVMVTQSKDVAFASLESLTQNAAQMEEMRNSVFVVLLVLGSIAAVVAIVVAFFAALSIANPIQMLPTVRSVYRKGMRNWRT
jgi:hypothetical protein